MEDTNQEILIIGGGIGGLTLALALHARGMHRAGLLAKLGANFARGEPTHPPVYEWSKLVDPV